MSKLRKPFYHLDEALTRWDMTERDVTAFVLSDELTLSATVAGLRILFGSLEDMADGEYFRIPEGYRYVIGTVDLARDDAWRVLREGSWTIASLKATPGTYQDISDDAIDNRHLVQRDDLVICRAEIECFEVAQGIALEPDAPMRRGAPTRFDWDGFWIELCRIIHEEGVPDTQSELVERMGEWFSTNRKSSPDESTIKKKIKPLWQHIRPTEQRQSA
jgi:hypothetical protein